MTTKRKKQKIASQQIPTVLRSIEQDARKSSAEIRARLGWSAQRYSQQRANRLFPMKHMEDLRAAIGWEIATFYLWLGFFLLQSERHERPRANTVRRVSR